MGRGSLKRIAALCLVATFAVWAGGALSVPAQISVPGTTVTAPTTTVTVPSTTVRVPSTTTTVSTPTTTVATPAPKATTPTVKAPAPKPKATVSDPVERVTKAVPLVESPSAPSTGETTDGAAGTVEKVADTATGAGGGSGDPLDAGGGAGGMSFLGGPGGDAPGGTFGRDSGGGSGSGGRTLAAMLAGAGSKELRAVLAQLEGCLPALPAGERRVLSMRAGLNGAPLTRGQVAQRLGVSRNAVRRTERRALNRLQFAAANTGCAAAVVGPFDPAGIGNLAPQLVHAGAVAVSGPGAGGDFAPARGLVGRSASPLFDLGGGGGGGPAWAIILFTVLLSVSVAALTRELRQSV